MSTTNDKAGSHAAARFALLDERGRIARQAEVISEAIRAMQGVREQMQDRLLAILVELQQIDASGSNTNDGERP